MKTLTYTLCIAIVVLGCRTTTKQGNFEILPAPQKMDIQGVSDISPSKLKNYFAEPTLNLPPVGPLLNSLELTNSPDAGDIVVSIDKDLNLGPEGYSLVITSDEIKITGKDRAGVLYGFMTLQQLVEDANDQQTTLPKCTIEDAPQLAYRAIQVDVKHHRETNEYYHSLLDQLTRYKVNAVIFEIEDKLKYPSRPQIGSEDGFTMEEMRELSTYAKERNIEISPLVQGLGHASFILKHDAYKSLRDDPNSDWAFNPLDEETYEVQFDLYRDAIEATPYGIYLHVGGDEVHTTGRGSGRSALDLQLYWLNRVSEFAAENNRIPIFWDDMPLKHAGLYGPMYNTNLTTEQVDSIWDQNGHKLGEFLDQFPKNCVYMRWNYHTPQTYGNARAMEWFTQNGLQVMGATAAQTRWVLMPQNESNIVNIRDFALSSIDNNISGLLCTLWDDDSPHFELYWRGIISFAAYTWSGNQRTIPEFKKAYRQRAFGLDDLRTGFIDSLEMPVAFWNRALHKSGDRRGLVSEDDPLENMIIDLPEFDKPGQWSEVYAEKLIDAKRMSELNDYVEESIAYSKKNGTRGHYTLDIYTQVNKLTRFSSEVLLGLQAYDMEKNPVKKSALAQQLKGVAGEFEQLRAELEATYGQTRILNKPDTYTLDQDHHRHLANQTLNFDWQFMSEIMFIQKLDSQLALMADSKI